MKHDTGVFFIDNYVFGIKIEKYKMTDLIQQTKILNRFIELYMASMPFKGLKGLKFSFCLQREQNDGMGGREGYHGGGQHPVRGTSYSEACRELQLRRTRQSQEHHSRSRSQW